MAETISFDLIARDLASKAFGDAGKSAEGFAGKLTAAGGVATGVFGAAITKMGEHLEETRKTLEQTISDAGQSFDEFSKQIDKTAGHEEKFGHSTADTNDALTILTRATGDTGKALSDMSLVTEIAAAHHSSLAEAADTVARMHGGAMRSLKEFGISTADVTAEAEKLAAAHGDTAKEEQFAAAQTLILQKIHGTAEAQADTFGGKIKALKTHFMDLAAELGTHVGPALTVLGPALGGVGAIMSSNLLPSIRNVITSMSGYAVKLVEMAGETIASFASQIAAAAAWAASMVASAAIAMAPFLPFIAAIAAVGAAAYLLYRNWDTIWSAIKTATAAAVDAISSVIGSIVGVFAGVIDWVKTNWPLILAIITGPFGLAVLEISKHWDTIVSFITGMPGRIASAASGMWDGIKEAFKATINWIIDGWNSLEFTLPKVDTHIPGVGKIGGWTLGTPDIPELRAMGGPVYGGKPYLVGEVGPELFMPGQSGTVVPNRTLAGLGGALIGHFEQHIHTKDDPDRIKVTVNQGLRDAAFLMGV